MENEQELKKKKLNFLRGIFQNFFIFQLIEN